MQVPPSVREAALAAIQARRPGIPVLELVRDSRMHDYPHANEDETERVLLFGRGDEQMEVRVALSERGLDITAVLLQPQEIGLEVLSPKSALRLVARGMTPLTVAGTPGPSSLSLTSRNGNGTPTTRQTSWVVL